MADDTNTRNFMFPPFDIIPRDASSIDDMIDQTPLNESPCMSRSSSKASSVDTGGVKPPKPRRPTNYAERKSSISQARGLAGQLKTLSLDQVALSSLSKREGGVMSPPTSASISPKQAMSTPPTATLTPVLSKAPRPRQK